MATEAEMKMAREIAAEHSQGLSPESSIKVFDAALAAIQATRSTVAEEGLQEAFKAGFGYGEREQRRFQATGQLIGGFTPVKAFEDWLGKRGGERHG